MNPGATTRPSASIVRLADAPAYLPTPTIFPPCTATSARNAGSPEPSTTVPFLMSRSNAIAFLLVAPLQANQRPSRRAQLTEPVVHRHASPTVRAAAYASSRRPSILSTMNNLHLHHDGRSFTLAACTPKLSILLRFVRSAANQQRDALIGCTVGSVPAATRA